MEQKIDGDTTVSATELAKVLGLTARRVGQLAQDGVIVRASRGKFVLSDAVRQYIEYAARNQTSEGKKIELDKDKAEAKLKAAKARAAELEVAELEGRMHRSEDVAAVLEALVYEIRANLTALPGRLAVDVAAGESPAQCADIIRREVHELMDKLSQYRYDPKVYEDRVRERRKWEIGADEGEEMN